MCVSISFLVGGSPLIEAFQPYGCSDRRQPPSLVLVADEFPTVSLRQNGLSLHQFNFLSSFLLVYYKVLSALEDARRTTTRVVNPDHHLHRLGLSHV